MRYIKVSELPESIKRALSSAGYFGKDIRVEVKERMEPRPPSADGRKGFVAICRLDDSNEFEIRWGSFGGINPFTKTVDNIEGVIDIPRDVAIVTGLSSAGTGYPAYATIHVSPMNMNPTLLPASSDLSDREKMILAIFKMLKSSARPGYLKEMKATNEEIEGLISRGFLKRNKAGAISITTEGKNNAGKEYYKSRF